MKKNYLVGSYTEVGTDTTVNQHRTANDGYKELACAVMRETVREIST